ncbi:extracellular elastinolytic metallo proteinase [Aspergillus sclerotioniger CBS 115572]|uniref:Extracellular metalloproteinase n=1 Tax=Aspergillus sclerotioniger CBS 115572 TaxID=1450535 RepID=A0A317XC69_9EURO|nr:extracellular elastinolytic metallo proteinase [Aspergillus sclerotioniger CBS 115572]PWY96109.1 extracellular elastinolytic metallo proteinase [Aspergillus sclerotioniger CBS 115572]
MMQKLLIGAIVLTLATFSHSSQSTSGSNHRIVNLNPFRLTARAEYVNSSQLATASTSINYGDQIYIETATHLVQSIFPNATFRIVEDDYVGDNGVAHINFRQTIHGIDIDNADFNVNVRKDGHIFSYGNSFYTKSPPEANPAIQQDVSDPVAAIKSASNNLKLSIGVGRVSADLITEKNLYKFRGTSGVVSDPTAKLVYFIKSDGSLALTWRVETDIGRNWLLTYVDANNSDHIHGVVDYVADASYEIYKWGLSDPTEGRRTIIHDPWDLYSSPFTWISDGTTNYTTTHGNNAIAQSNPTGHEPYMNNFRPNSPDDQFEYPYSPSMSPPTSYINASIVQLFYTANTYHDLLYTLGFTEKAGNFQWNNNGKGGIGHDYVVLDVQDGQGINGASFATPPDGQPGRMRMQIWTWSIPKRDGAFDFGLIIHEYTHGLSNRLTGGPANTKCLTGLEPGGMGEGWGDFMATALRLKPNDTRLTDYTMSPWASNKQAGIRDYPYSTSLTTNPLTYTSVNGLRLVHKIGTVWATMLYEVLWNLVDKYGMNDGAKPIFQSAGVPTDGKYLTMKLIVDAMALQPCNPNFIQARDAIIDADTVLTKGSNHCEIWKAFAKRGLGQGAKYGVWNRAGSTEVPFGVC